MLGKTLAEIRRLPNSEVELWNAFYLMEKGVPVHDEAELSKYIERSEKAEKKRKEEERKQRTAAAFEGLNFN